MPRFGVYSRRGSNQLLLDCQAERLAHLSTRFVVPLVSRSELRAQIPRLHPELAVRSEAFVMATHLASAIPVSALGALVVQLSDDDHRIVGALDVLIGTA